LRLSTSDGLNPTVPRRDLAEAYREEVAGYVGSLSTRARLDQFAADYRFPLPFAVRADGAVELSLADAMDFLTRKDYVDNWLSECHEQFCGLEYAGWLALLAEVGFEVDPVSRPWRNDWLVEHRLAPVAELSTVDGVPLPWPETHVLLVARRPRNT
jgi:hypothetical protein